VSSARAGGPAEVRNGDAQRAAEGARAELAERATGRRTAVVAGAGRPLPRAVRAPMERRFRHDFSAVRVHDGAAADAAASGEAAAAVTRGRDIVFAAGRYAPETASGRRLLAHELGHVAQQAQPPLAGAGGPAAEAALEAEADRAAAAVSAGSATGLLSPVPAGLVGLRQRQPQTATPAPQTPTRKPPPAGVEEAAGRPLDAFLRLDTVTVFVISEESCLPCHLLIDDLADLRSARPPESRVRLRVVQVDVDPDVPVNEDLVRSLTGHPDVPSFPQAFTYVERRRVGPTVTSYTSGGDNMAPFREALDDAERRSSTTGAKWGALAGGVLGAVGGTILGAHLGAGIQGVGGFGGGFLGLFGGAALGGLVGAGIGWLAGKVAGSGGDIGAAPLSAARISEVHAFVEGGATSGIKTRGRAYFEEGAAELARDAVTLWVADRAALPLTPKDRRILIIEMLRGDGGRLGNRAILKVIEESSDGELLEIFNSVGPTPEGWRDDSVSIEDLRSSFGSAEKAYLEMLTARLRSRFTVRPRESPATNLAIALSDVKREMAKAYADTRRSDARRVDSEVTGVVIGPDDPAGARCHFQRKVEGATSAILTTIVEARQQCGDDPLLATYHTHPGWRPAGDMRLAPSSDDMQNALNGGAREHYVIDPWVVHLITHDGYRPLGSTAALIGVTPPPIPSGTQSTLELG
jgi:hypothetical protein